METTLDLTADVIDVLDVMNRYSDLEGEPITDEFKKLSLILEDLRDNGGDEQWRGDWYPSTLIKDSHFLEYARELVVDCDDIPSNLPHYIVIDWDATARNIRTDYTSTKIDGVTYWYR
jgi:hypothetical protein